MIRNLLKDAVLIFSCGTMDHVQDEKMNAFWTCFLSVLRRKDKEQIYLNTLILDVYKIEVGLSHSCKLQYNI